MKQIEPSFHTRALCCAAIALPLLLTLPAARAADSTQIKMTQEALKREQLFAGQVNGQLDEETIVGLRRFQIREGLPVTGQLDGATLVALDRRSRTAKAPDAKTSPAVAAVAATAASSGDPTLSVRDRAREVVQEDQEFLQKLEPAPAETRTAATTATAPEPVAEYVPSSRPASRPSAAISRTRQNTETRQNTARRQNTQTRQSAQTRQNASVQENTRVQQAPPEPSETLSENEVRRVVQNYLDAAEDPTPNRELSFYADKVDYFGQGRVSHEAIARDQRNYYRKWPQREFSLVGEPRMVRAGSNDGAVRYRVRYSLRSNSDAARGQTEHLLQLRRSGDGLKIVGIRERKLTD